MDNLSRNRISKDFYLWILLGSISASSCNNANQSESGAAARAAGNHSCFYENLRIFSDSSQGVAICFSYNGGSSEEILSKKSQCESQSADGNRDPGLWRESSCEEKTATSICQRKTPSLSDYKVFVYDENFNFLLKDSPQSSQEICEGGTFTELKSPQVFNATIMYTSEGFITSCTEVSNMTQPLFERLQSSYDHPPKIYWEAGGACQNKEGAAAHCLESIDSSLVQFDSYYFDPEEVSENVSSQCKKTGGTWSTNSEGTNDSQ